MIWSLLVGFVVAADTQGLARDGRLDVWVSIPPQAFLVQKIGGDAVQVHVLLDSGQEPHTFQPAPRQLGQLAEADLFVTIGLPFEAALVDKIRGSGFGVEVVDGSAGITRRRENEHAPHAGHHEHGSGSMGEDPHVWLSPENACIIAENISTAMAGRAKAHASRFEASLSAFCDEMRELDDAIRAMLAPCQGRTFYVFHPAYGYFSDAYGLIQKAMEIQGKSPSPKDLAGLIRKARADGVRVIFVQPQFDARAARALAQAIDGVVEVMDPLAYDLAGNMWDMARAIRRSLDGEATSPLEPKQ